LLKQSQYYVRFIVPWSQNGSFEPLQSGQFLNRSFVPILINGHESWVQTEKVLSQVKAVQMGFFRKVYGVIVRDSLWRKV